MTDVKGKWAFITGASRGLGYLTANLWQKEAVTLFSTAEICNTHRRLQNN